MKLRGLLGGASALVLAFMFGNSAEAQTASMNLCTGGNAGNYYFSGSQIAGQAKGVVSVNVIETKGSIDNLTKIEAGECDAAIVQSDAYLVYKKEHPKSLLNLERVDTLYKEYVHLVCSREADIDGIKDLTADNTVLIGPNGSGTMVTWTSFGLNDKSYTEIKTLPIGGTRAMTKVKDGSEAQCMLFVSGLNSSSMKEVDLQGDFLKLVAVDDWDFNDTVDDKGKKVYNFESIPGGTYDALQDGVFSSAVDTITVDAVLVVKADWIDENPDVYEQFLKASLRAQPAIRERVGQ